ncbi:BT4734/BF3469 family protein [Aridibaculum aurantiacum]|uniref:BT4734/BF3469 family protein n=1 Tax=Aridibaculum aurantiacum TaxID=2810307 RepID=UPI001A95F0F6|nr:BT4734/BF3469 family protein [Aridibaculum aurantiacum]
MELSKEAILNKTHYGLNIYAHVLKQYYPGTVLSLSGRDCQPALNPFNNDKSTLLISIENNLAVHKDAELSDFNGNVFDFATLHYKLQEQDLIAKLNEELHLHLGEEYSFYNRGNIIVRPEVKEPAQLPLPCFSYFLAPIKNTIPEKAVTLIDVYKIIRSDKFAKQTISLRSINDKKAAKDYKAAHFDYVTFSGIFSKRADNALQKHSGLLTVDLDHISNAGEWVDRLLQDEYFETELLFVSPSGDGLKWIIPIDTTKATHSVYFKSISNYLQLTYSLQLDTSGSDCSRACFLPHDPNIYINPKYL